MFHNFSNKYSFFSNFFNILEIISKEQKKKVKNLQKSFTTNIP